jgi:xanthine dehydrogenase small subunit
VIEFLLNDEKVILQDIDPNTTVLQYLREHRRRMGTKEGCASGDCGACTVAMVQLSDQGQLEYKTINACITFISALAGKQLLSIEDLKSDKELHSTQKSMVDSDGSQCGFCTPGFVMSLFTLQKNQKKYSRHAVQQALAGNLCRCTGYQAIDNAAKQALSSTVVDHFDPCEQSTATKLRNLTNDFEQQAVLELNQHKAYIPKDIKNLVKLLNGLADSQIVAGGTDIAIPVTQHAKPITQLISISQIKELQQYNITENTIEIGACVTLHQCQTILAPYFTDFSLLLERFASLQIRNQGTLAGNIANASPIGDTPPALIALGASIQLTSVQGQRQILLEEFFIDYRQTQLAAGEFIEKIIIPLPKKASDHRQFFKVYKISKRLDDDISALCAAFAVTLDKYNKIITIKLAFGGMAAIAKRATLTEKSLTNRIFSEETIETTLNLLAKDFQPLTDFRASSDYRLLVAQNLLRKFYIECNTDNSEQNSGNTRIFDYV